MEVAMIRQDWVQADGLAFKYPKGGMSDNASQQDYMAVTFEADGYDIYQIEEQRGPYGK